MNIIKKAILAIKNMFTKKNELKQLEAPKIISGEDKRGNFIESLKISTIKKKNKKRVETLICIGDGLGIQKKLSC